MNKSMRAIIPGIEIRAKDEETRTVEFVAATENGVDTYYGREFLDMAGLDMARYQANPVILDTHSRDSAAAVVGKAVLTVEGNKLAASVTFAKTERAEDVWQLVDGGFINALSVGFVPRQVTTIEERENYELNGQDITGPARIVKQWELYEISVVPVPADPAALRREYEDGEKTQERFDKLCSILLDKGLQMEEVKKEVTEEVKAEPVAEEVKEQAPEPVISTRKQDILDITPAGYEDVAARCIVDGKTVEEARVEFHRAIGLAPIGVTEPVVSDKKPVEETKIEKRDLIG